MHRKLNKRNPGGLQLVLDYLTPDWHGLVIGDYAGVMPVKISSRFGIRLIQMPHDIHNLDLFSSLTQLSSLKHLVFKHPLFRNFRFISYSFLPDVRMDSSNTITEKFLSFRNNYELSLKSDYETIFSTFSKTHRKNVRRFLKENFTIEHNTNPTVYKTLQQQRAKDKPELYTPESHNANFSKMVQTAINLKKGALYTATKKGEIAGACFFLFGKKRIILYHITNAFGRKNYATFGLINHFLQEYSQQNKLLDFAGSDIESIASFNKSFGADHLIYPAFQKNNLPLILKLGKRAHLSNRLKNLTYMFYK
ncbi:hypothetical protein [Marinilabilia salmonicolor]|uniref:hypothetical protein n=1 Tax=Marinilabilia salmonicolor TaxID=989 RepID=UPI0004691A83|nr:hypothetical protein [Marinilabilia salmonicolor]